MGNRQSAPKLFGILVYLPKSTVDEVDASVARRRSLIPRTAWIREAIYEKLEREQKGTSETIV
jgi:metal-responsive CopG/Arc/MetJ family transcriptional regulator